MPIVLESSLPWNPTTTADTVAAIPAYPATISMRTMRRRTGCPTTDSDSEVVKPTPMNADCAWNEALSRERPVRTRARVPARTAR